jgi:tetratricopeptide (TPR) repeat protein
MCLILIEFKGMNTKFFILTFIAVIISFIGGFLLANALNRNEINQLRGSNEKQLSETTQQSPDQTTLSDEEIKKRIAEADQNPENISYQKNLGLALYRYAAMKQNAELLGEVSRLLSRANAQNPDDYDVLVALGNANFDIGYIKKENDKLVKSREFYQAALKQKPEDVDVRTDLGLSFYLINPPETDKAITEFEKSLNENPNHEKTLQVIAQAYLSQKNLGEAETYLKRLEKVNPQNTYLPDLQKELQKDNPTSIK